jgi:hypothetical protein
MNRLSDEKTLELLRGAMPAYSVDGPPDDLWPRVRHRIDRAGTRPPAGDWVLAAALVLLCLLRPSLMGILLWHF